MEQNTSIIDAESPRFRNAPKLKMVYHFVRVEASDIKVEGDTEGQCLDKALVERAKACKPAAVKGEVVE